MAWKTRYKTQISRLKQELYALYFAYRDPRTPLAVRLFVAVVVGFAFSPIDLIPDFIPVLGYVDDLILLPIGIWLALRLIPPEVMNDSRAKAAEQLTNGKPVNKAAAVVIVALWLTTAVLISIWFWS